MNRYLFLLSTLGLPLTLAACTLPVSPLPATVVTLTASETAGEVPLTVSFVATADSASERFNWTVAGQPVAETGDTLTHTFTSPGLYLVTAMTGDASDSVTVRADALDLPNTGPAPDELSLTATPGGPAPWGVRYTVRPALAGVQARCREGAAFEPVREGSFACLHEPGDTVQARFVQESGEVTATAEIAPDVTANEGVAFAGRWRYRSRGTTETFSITEGNETAGSSADGRFKLFTITQRGGLVAEFTLDGRTVVLTPVPEPDGRQVFFAEVYGLTLEPLADDPEEGDG